MLLFGPGEWQNIETKWVMISKDNDYWKGKLDKYDDIKFCDEGYNLASALGTNSYDTKLHCKSVRNELQYTNTIGKWINVEDCDLK